MGNRRMISKTVTQTQRFLQMPLEAQALYFHLIQNADDDGIVEAFPIVRMIGANEDNLKLLQVKNFVKPLNEEMVY
ncbi:TPA: DNA replication protein DnaD, partial [Streptococcus agalactiae]|nr:DNA replication protein DnaD [Streptococcus agalactiae]